jgi:hypothetical protein
VDTQTTYNGNPTFRIEPGNNYGADHGGIDISPGEHIVMECWIKTSGTPAGAYTGARIGLDFYGANGRICGPSSPQEAAAGITYPNAPSSLQQTEAAYYVPWGSGWTLITWSFVVPATCTGDGALASGVPLGQQSVPTYCIPWLQIYAGNEYSNTYTSWFSDFQFYINP